ncbi:Hypothetical protein HDN1F_35800 [gamma proteobacterium HdN1]|nr:Hypothetical protein HDN1F_35800 [gamma proteobacterium HdN1]
MLKHGRTAQFFVNERAMATDHPLRVAPTVAPTAPKALTIQLLLALAAMLALVSGCAHQPPAPIDPEAQWPMPESMHEFVLESPDQQVIGELQTIRAHRDDTFPDIARRFNVGYEELVTANPGIDPWLPGEGTRILIPSQWILPNAPRKGIVVNLAAMRLFYYVPPTKASAKSRKGKGTHSSGPIRVITHPVGIGRVKWNTPQGTTRIVAKNEAPAWRPTAAILKEHAEMGDPLPAVVPPGPDNPMGNYVMRLGWPEYAIHGTNKPASIGLRGTHGCLRMYPEDIEALFQSVPVNTPVAVVNQPQLVGNHNGALLLQRYPALEDDRRNHRRNLNAQLRQAQAAHIKKNGAASKRTLNWTLIGETLKQQRALPVPVSDTEASYDDWLAHAGTPVKNRVPGNATWDGEGDATHPQSNTLATNETAENDLARDSASQNEASQIQRASNMNVKAQSNHTPIGR